RSASFDEDDFDRVLDELDDRYIAGEGAAHAEQVGLWRQVATAFNRRDWAAMALVHPPDMVEVSHARLQLPLDVDATSSLAADVPDARVILRTFEADGNVSLVQTEIAGHVPDGGEVSWAHWSVGVTGGGGFARLELFDLDDATAARARFAQLAEEQSAPFP